MGACPAASWGGAWWQPSPSGAGSAVAQVVGVGGGSWPPLIWVLRVRRLRSLLGSPGHHGSQQQAHRKGRLISPPWPWPNFYFALSPVNYEARQGGLHRVVTSLKAMPTGHLWGLRLLRPKKWRRGRTSLESGIHHAQSVFLGTCSPWNSPHSIPSTRPVPDSRRCQVPARCGQWR